MILGYFLIDEAGSVVLDRFVSPMSSAENQALFSSTISAIGGLLDQVFQAKLKHLETERFHLYFGAAGNYTLIVISDIEDERLEELAQKIILDIKNTFPDLVLIQLDKSLAEQVRSRIEEILFKEPPSMREIKKLLDIITGFMDLSRGEVIGFEDLMVDVKGSKRPPLFKRVRAKGISIEELLKLFHQGKFAEVARGAEVIYSMNRVLSVLAEVDVGDLARILFAKASYFLNSFGLDFPSPSIEEVLKVVSEIGDGLAREYLEIEFNAFIKLGVNGLKRDFVARNLNEIMNRVSGGGISGEVYRILFTPIAYGPLIEVLENHYRGKSEFLRALVLEIKELLKMFSTRPSSMDEVFEEVARYRSLVEDEIKKESMTAAIYHHIYNFTTVWGLVARQINLDEARSLLRSAWGFYRKYQDNFNNRKLLKTTHHELVNKYFTYNVIYSLLFELGENRDPETIDSILSEIKGEIKHLFSLRLYNRVILDFYYLTLSGLLAIYSRLAFEENRYISDIPIMLEEFLSGDLETLWKHGEYHYIHIFINLLEVIGNTGAFLRPESIRKSLLLKVGRQIELSLEKFKNSPLIYELEILKSIRFYAMSRTDEGYERARKLVIELEETTSNFVKEMAKIILEKYS